MNRGEMKENIRYAVGLREPEEQAVIEREIWHGILDVLRRTGCFVQCIVADVPDDKTRIEFAAPAGVIRALHILRGGVVMDRTTFPPLAGCFSQAGQILFFAEAFAVGEQLQLYAVPRPPKMSSDTDLLESESWGGIPEEFQDAVELYACSKLASRADDNTSAMGTSYWQMYVGQDGMSGRISEIKRQINRMSGMTLGPARLRMAPGGYRAGYGNGNGVGAIGYIGPVPDYDAEFMAFLANLDPTLRDQVSSLWANHREAA